MPDTLRLTSSADIRSVFAARLSAGGDHVVAHALPRAAGEPSRTTVVAGRKVGNAVRRNRAKRRLRACLRLSPPPAGVDLVVTAKAGADAVDADVLHREVADAVRRACRRALARS